MANQEQMERMELLVELVQADPKVRQEQLAHQDYQESPDIRVELGEKEGRVSEVMKV